MVFTIFSMIILVISTIISDFFVFSKPLYKGVKFFHGNQTKLRLRHLRSLVEERRLWSSCSPACTNPTRAESCWTDPGCFVWNAWLKHGRFDPAVFGRPGVATFVDVLVFLGVFFLFGCLTIWFFNNGLKMMKKAWGGDYFAVHEIFRIWVVSNTVIIMKYMFIYTYIIYDVFFPLYFDRSKSRSK